MSVLLVPFPTKLVQHQRQHASYVQPVNIPQRQEVQDVRNVSLESIPKNTDRQTLRRVFLVQLLNIPINQVVRRALVAQQVNIQREVDWSQNESVIYVLLASTLQNLDSHMSAQMDVLQGVILLKVE